MGQELFSSMTIETLANCPSYISNAPQVHLPDTKEPSTNISFVFSPPLCEEILGLALEENECSGRALVCYTPVLQYLVEGWDSGVVIDPFLQSRRQELDESFFTWGVTEKIEPQKLRIVRDTHPGLSLSCIMSTICVAEEVEFAIGRMCDLVMLVPKEHRINPPVTLDQLERKVVRPFSIEAIPLGVIYNEDRKESPIVIVIAITLFSNSMIKSKDQLFAEGFIGLSRIQEVLKRISTHNRVDSWGRLIASFWINNLEMIEQLKRDIVDRDQLISIIKQLGLI